MTATIEVDKLGRFVIPKKLREALHLQPGDKLEAHTDGERLTLEPLRLPKGLVQTEGRCVFDGGAKLHADINELIDEDRRRRAEYVAGLHDQP